MKDYIYLLHNIMLDIALGEERGEKLACILLMLHQYSTSHHVKTMLVLWRASNNQDRKRLCLSKRNIMLH